MDCLEEGFRTARRLDYHSILATLGITLGTRYRFSSDELNLGKSIFYHRKVLSLLPPNVNKSPHLDCLGYSPMDNSRHLPDVEEAISMLISSKNIKTQVGSRTQHAGCGAISSLYVFRAQGLPSSRTRRSSSSCTDSDGGTCFLLSKRISMAECSSDFGDPSQALDACSLAHPLGETVTRRYKDLKKDGSRPKGPRAAQTAIVVSQYSH